MAYTNSWAWPNIFNVSQNQVNVVEDNKSIVSRTRLLILSEPTSLFNSPDFGVGLKRHLWQYNTENQKAIIKDRIVVQLKLNEPSVFPEKTQYANGLLFTGSPSDDINQDYNQLKMTVAVVTNYNETLEVTVEDGSN